MVEINLSESKVLVTGGAGVGVGSGLVEALYDSRALVIINDIDQKQLDMVAEKYPDAMTINADLQDQQAVENMFAQINEFCGGINGLVNNAGVGLSKMAHHANDQDYDRIFDIDVKAVWRLSKLFVNQCLNRGETGNIVNISSIHAFGTQSRYALYASAKSAIVGLTRGMACEIGPLGFRINAIAPGYVHADQNYELMKSWTDNPEQWVRDFVANQQVLNYDVLARDIGNMAIFLLSDLSKSITGQNIYVDGGVTNLIFNRDFTEDL